jgi:hypothetical protein
MPKLSVLTLLHVLLGPLTHIANINYSFIFKSWILDEPRCLETLRDFGKPLVLRYFSTLPL